MTDGIGSRVLRAGLRLGGRLEIPGWFPVVVERVHPHLGDTGQAEHRVDGALMSLDLGDWIQRRIYYDCHEPQELAALRRLTRPGDVVVDVGAFVGLFALVAAAHAGRDGAVHAFEPVPATFARLKANVEANAFRNIVLTRAAVGAEPGTLELGLQGPEVPGARESAAYYTRAGTFAAVTAPMVSIDDYAARHLADRPIRLVKIDAEGSEPDVIAGMSETLAAHPPDALLMEVNVPLLAREGRTGAEITEPLLQAGYELWRPGRRGRLVPTTAGRLARAPWGAALGRRYPRSLGLHIARGLLGRSGLLSLVAVKPGAAERSRRRPSGRRPGAPGRRSASRGAPA